MKASFYNTYEHPVVDKIASYCGYYPDEEEALSDIDWHNEDDLLLCYDEIEENYGLDLSGEFETALDGEMKVANLIELVESMEKSAKRTSMRDRQRMREYRLKNKAKLKQKAAIRKMKIQSGAHRVKRRIGTAEGGYTFIDDGSRVPSPATSRSGGRGPSGDWNFTPDLQTNSKTKQTTLAKVAFVKQSMIDYIKSGFGRTEALERAESDWLSKTATVEAVENHQNPIAGKQGFPTPPKPPKIEKPKPPKPPKIKSSLNNQSLPSGKVNSNPNKIKKL